MTKGELISYAIDKECRRDSLVRWCKSWGITIEEFVEFLYLGGQSFDKRNGDDRNCFTCIHLNEEECDMQKCEYKERATEPSQIARDIATILENEKDMRVILKNSEPEIIRCKECEHWDKSWTNDWKPNCHYCPMMDRVCGENWYCADAERRTDEETDIS